MTERRLLIVDDDAAFCDVLARTLKRRGFDTFVALNIDAARALLLNNAFSHAIVDLRIGDESGLEMTRILHAASQHTRILILTGYASIATAVEAIKLGAMHYLTKPAGADEIVAAFSNDAGDAQVAPPTTSPSPKRLEWEYLQRVLLENNGNVSATARQLGMHRRTLQRKLAKKPVRH